MRFRSACRNRTQTSIRARLEVPRRSLCSICADGYAVAQPNAKRRWDGQATPTKKNQPRMPAKLGAGPPMSRNGLHYQPSTKLRRRRINPSLRPRNACFQYTEFENRPASCSSARALSGSSRDRQLRQTAVPCGIISRTMTPHKVPKVFAIIPSELARQMRGRDPAIQSQTI
jgi:hypothetical protein